VITVQARHIIERRPRLFENGFEGRKDVLRLTAKIGRKPSLGVGPDDAGDEDLVADPDCWRILVSFEAALNEGGTMVVNGFGIGFLLSVEALLELFI